MTISKMKKRYYSLSFITAVIISSIIITVDKKFDTFVFVPYKYNKKLKDELNLKIQEKNLYQKKIKELKDKNEKYLTYVIKEKQLKNELKQFFTLFSNKIKIVKINVIDVKSDKEYYNKAKVILQANPNNQYITPKFAVEMTTELIKEVFGDNAENIKINNNNVEFTYINYFKRF